MKTCFDFFQEGFLKRRGHREESTWILDGFSFILYPRFDLNINLDPLNLAVLFLKSGPTWTSKYAAVHMEENPIFFCELDVVMCKDVRKIDHQIFEQLKLLGEED